jgi:hypothetical protein
MKNYDHIATDLMRAMLPVKADFGDQEALAIYLVGCAVSLLQEPTPTREAEIRELLRELAEKTSGVAERYRSRVRKESKA